MNIYLVTTGSCSDYHVVAAFSTRDAAEEMSLLHSDANDVEEYELDSPIPQHPRGHAPWCVHMDREGEVLDTGRRDMSDGWPPTPEPATRDTMPCMAIFVWAIDEQGAIKSANERRAQLLAENMWDDDHDAWYRRKFGVEPCKPVPLYGHSQTVTITKTDVTTPAASSSAES